MYRERKRTRERCTHIYLSRGDYVALGFNSSATEKRFPVRLSRLYRKGGRHQQHLSKETV